jgi:hypothetical protein
VSEYLALLYTFSLCDEDEEALEGEGLMSKESCL